MKIFDPSQSSALGLLGEMSYSELKERLEVLKVRDAEKEEDRRLAILADKRDRESELRARVENIVRVRGECSGGALVFAAQAHFTCAPQAD